MNLDVFEVKEKRFNEISEIIQQPGLYDNPVAAADYL